jgi:hypothetical protein
MIGLEKSSIRKSGDTVHYQHISTLRSLQVIMGDSTVNLNAANFSHVVGEFKCLVLLRLCLLPRLFEWLQYCPVTHARFRVRRSDKLPDLGEKLIRQTAKRKATL